MSMPKRVIVEYEDGTSREASFSSLSKEIQTQLLKLKTQGDVQTKNSENYLLLQWKDGWKEIIAVDGHATELLRYYVIERVEEVGRLSLSAGDDYPLLQLIKRLPGRIESILFIGKQGPQSYRMEEKMTVREGGKVEHIFYDRKRPNFSMEDEPAASARFKAILDSLRSELHNKGLDWSKLSHMAAEERVIIYKEIAKVLDLKGTEKQSDVFGFIQLGIEKLAASE
jgi:hypothetical protein